MFAGLGKLVLLALALSAADALHPIRVTVVVVFASTKSNAIDPKLAALALEVQKREPALIGFLIVDSQQKSLAVGGAHTFSLPEKLEMPVKICKPKDKDGRVGMAIQPPGLGEITYTCMCDKFFPVVTPQVMAKGERLIVVVMAKPCPGK